MGSNILQYLPASVFLSNFNRSRDQIDYDDYDATMSLSSGAARVN